MQQNISTLSVSGDTGWILVNLTSLASLLRFTVWIHTAGRRSHVTLCQHDDAGHVMPLYEDGRSPPPPQMIGQSCHHGEGPTVIQTPEVLRGSFHVYEASVDQHGRADHHGTVSFSVGW